MGLEKGSAPPAMTAPPKPIEPPPAAESVKVSTYRPLNNGPYPTDAPKLRKILFTPVQIKATISGSRPGPE